MQRFNKILRHPVIDSFRVILRGNIATQIVSLISYTFIARIYSTLDFGYSALFISVAMLFSIFQSGQVYWYMFSNEDEAKQLDNYHDSISYLFKTSPFLILLCFLVTFTSFNKLGLFILFVPVFSFSYSLIEINKNYANSLGNHKNSVSQVFFSRSYGQGLKILFSFLSVSGPVLVFSELIANLYVGLKGSLINIREIRKRKIFYIYKKYNKHILFYTPINFFNLFVQELPILLSTYIYGLKASGSYFLISRLIINPVTLVGNSFATSQIKKINSYNKSPEAKMKFLIKSYSMLFVVGLIPSLVLFFYGREMFELFLGRGHEETANLAKYVSLLLPLRLIKAMSYISGINADIYKETFIIKSLLILTIICISIFLKDLKFEQMILIILALEGLVDVIIAIIGLKNKRTIG